MQYSTQYYRSNSKKNLIDNVDIMNAFCKTIPAGTRRCKDVGIRLDFGRIGRDQIRRLENFPLQPYCNVNPTSESDVIPTSP